MKTYILLFIFLFTALFRANAAEDEEGCVILESECFNIKYAGALINSGENKATLNFTVTAKCDVPFNFVNFQIPEGVTPSSVQNGNPSFTYDVQTGISSGVPAYRNISFTATGDTPNMLKNGASDVFTYTIPLDQYNSMEFMYITVSGEGYTFTVCINPKGCTARQEIPKPVCELTTEDGGATFGFVDAVPGFGPKGDRTRVRISVKNNTPTPIGTVSIEPRAPATHLTVAPTNSLGQYSFIYLWDWEVDHDPAVGYTGVHYYKINTETSTGNEEEILTFLISTVSYQADPFFQFTMISEDFSTFSSIGFYTEGVNQCKEEPFEAFPVELSSFSGTTTDQGVKLSWTTASERDNDYFEVQRSTNGKEFKTIGTVKGAGNSSTKLSYSFTDSAPAKGINYYRLQQVDFNKTSSISRTLAKDITSTITASSSMTVYPNPATGDNVTITFGDNTTTNKNIVLSITDMNGRKVYEKVITSGDSELNLSLPEINVAKGLYLIKVQGDNKVETQKLIIR